MDVATDSYKAIKANQMKRLSSVQNPEYPQLMLVSQQRMLATEDRQELVIARTAIIRLQEL